MTDQPRMWATAIGDKDDPPPTGEGEPERGERAAGSIPIAGGERIQAAGRVIENPVSGERIVIRQSGAQTGGRLLSFDLFLPPGAHVPARHVHPVQQERFTLVTGQMRFRLGRRSMLLQPGESVLVPPGAAHWFGNAGADTAHARVEVRPALRMQELFETTEAIGLAERERGARRPRPSDLARVVLEFRHEVAVPNVPSFLVQALLAPLAWLGQRRAARQVGVE